MENLRRALRRYQKEVKYIKRLKMCSNSGNNVRFIDNDGQTLINPTWVDLKNNQNSYFYKLKTMSTVCSCSMCAYPKYNRAEQKKIDKMFLEFK